MWFSFILLTLHVFPKLYRPFAQKLCCVFVVDWETHTNSLCDVMISIRDLTWHHDIILWCHMKSHHRHNDFTWEFPSGKAWESHFLTLWPWPLAYNPSLAKVIPKIKIIGQTVRPWECWHTHRQTALILLPRPLTSEVIICTHFEVIILPLPTMKLSLQIISLNIFKNSYLYTLLA